MSRDGSCWVLVRVRMQSIDYTMLRKTKGACTSAEYERFNRGILLNSGRQIPRTRI